MEIFSVKYMIKHPLSSGLWLLALPFIILYTFVHYHAKALIHRE